MTPEFRSRIEAIFEAALDQRRERRGAFVARSCGDDEVLRAEVEALLAGHELEAGVPDRPIIRQPAGPHPPEHADRRVGPYRVLRELGRGGMGVVYLAERDDGQFRRRVAIKLVRSGVDDGQIHRRFLAERQILASLNHPNIAQLLDGGVADGELPYLVMEYVEGLPITAYCDRHRLGIKTRLRLFQEVCAAIHHAHQNLVIHRDLKPSNIVVEPGPGEPVGRGRVKLLDFGIAKVLNPALEPAGAPFTRAEQWVMTPEYASPEQVRGETLATTSDIYSLGLVLYELLSGHRPYQLTTRSPNEIVALICERDPERPSTRAGRTEVLTLEDGSVQRLTPQAVAAARGLAAERLRRELRGDLDAIVMMALRKEPHRRYGSAEVLSEDIQRYLDGLPVAAHRGSRGYRVGKFLRRHRVEAAAAGLVALSLMTGAGVALQKAALARQERDHAAAAQAGAEEVARFLEGLFAAADPYAPVTERLDTLRVREFLARGASQLTALADQPLVQAQMLDAVGRVYRNLGLYEEAKPLLEQALSLRRAAYGSLHAEVGGSLTNLAALLIATNEYERARQLLQEALTIHRRAWGEDHPSVAVDLNYLAVALRELGQYEEAERRHLEATEMLRRTAGERDPRLASFTTELVATLEWQGKHEAAEQFAREAVRLHRTLFGDAHPSYAIALRELGLLLQRKGDYPAAEALFRDAYEIAVRSLGEDHPQVADLLNRLASVRWWQKDLAAADSIHRKSLMLKRRLYGDTHLEIAYGLNNLASVLRDRQQYAAADSLLREALEITRAVVGEEHSAYWIVLSNLGGTLAARRDCGVAEHLLLDAGAGLRRTLPNDRVRIAINQRSLGSCLTQLGRHVEAERVLLESYTALLPRGERDQLVQETATELVALYTAWGKPAQAAAYRPLLGPRNSVGEP